MVRSEGENWFQFSWDITSQVIAHPDSQTHFNLLFALHPHKYREKLIHRELSIFNAQSKDKGISFYGHL